MLPRCKPLQHQLLPIIKLFQFLHLPSILIFLLVTDSNNNIIRTFVIFRSTTISQHLHFILMIPPCKQGNFGLVNPAQHERSCEQGGWPGIKVRVEEVGWKTWARVGGGGRRPWAGAGEGGMGEHQTLQCRTERLGQETERASGKCQQETKNAR